MAHRLLTLVLCWSLVTLETVTPVRALAQTSGSGSTPVQHETNNCEGANQTACDQLSNDLNAAGSDNGSGLSEEEMNRRREQLERDKQTGTVVDLGSGDGTGAGGGVSAAYHTVEFATLLIAIGTGVAGSTYAFGCANQPSAWVFGLVALAYLLAEIIQTAQTKDASDRRLTIIKNVSQESFDLQTEALNQAIEQTKTAADHANTRYIVTLVMACLFLVAAIVALVEGILNKYPGSWNDQCSGGAFLPRPILPSNKISVKRALALNWQNFKSAAPNMAEKTLDAILPVVGIPEAKAEDGSLVAIGIVAALAIIFMPILQIVRSALGATKSSGFVRAAIMAVYAAFVFTAAGIIKSKKDQLDERVKKYQELLSQLTVRLKPKKGEVSDTKMTDPGKSTVEAPDSTSTELQPGGNLKGNCAVGDQKKANFTADLGCKKPPSNIEGNPTVPTNEVIDLPGSVMDGVKNVKDFPRDIGQGRGVSGQMKGYDGKAYATLNKIKGELGKKLTEFAKKYKDEDLGSFEEAELGYKKKIMGDVQKSMDKYTPTQLASMMGQLLETNQPDSKALKDLFKDEKLFGTNKKGALPNAVAPPPKIKLGDDNETTPAASTEEEVTSADALKNLNYKEQDVVEDKGASIFLIITNRYRKTAYPVFFNKDAPSTSKGKTP